MNKYLINLKKVFLYTCPLTGVMKYESHAVCPPPPKIYASSYLQLTYLGSRKNFFLKIAEIREKICGCYSSVILNNIEQSRNYEIFSENIGLFC